jgi:hypothetical protein
MGFICLTSGLVAPLWAVALLLVVWVVLTAVLVVLARRRRYWVLAVPVGAFVVWLAMLSVGDAWLGWTA